MHILQLTGGQSWPNFLPILYFRPKHITFLTSNDEKQTFQKQINAIIQTCIEMGINTKVIETLETKSSFPTIEECSQLLNKKSFDLINLTGGSKPMAIAAHSHAKIHQIPAFYLDTRRHNNLFEFINPESLETHFQAPNPTEWEELAKSIDVRIALKSQGFEVSENFQKPKEHEVNFSLSAAKLRTYPKNNSRISQFIASLRRQFMQSDRFHKKSAPLRNALQTPITVSPDSPEAHYLQAAAHHGILDQIDQSSFFLTKLDPIDTATDTLRSAAENNFKLLEGGWFELALYSQLKVKKSFNSIEWSVQPSDSSANNIGETDLVAFNYKTLSLHFISCKTSKIHGSNLDHIQGLRRRANKEGGSFSKAELWLFAPSGNTEQERIHAKNTLEQQCKEQNVTLRIYSEQFLSAS
jgi:hypothetical protein